MEWVPLAAGDPHRVFPDLPDEEQVLGALQEADETMRRLAAHFGLDPNASRYGLMFQGSELVSHVEPPGDVSLSIELEVVRGGTGPPWEPVARIFVTCDHPVDCGMHQVELWPDNGDEYHVPLEAARGLAQAARWLFDQATSHPLEHWVVQDRRDGGP